MRLALGYRLSPASGLFISSAESDKVLSITSQSGVAEYLAAALQIKIPARWRYSFYSGLSNQWLAAATPFGSFITRFSMKNSIIRSVLNPE